MALTQDFKETMKAQPAIANAMNRPLNVFSCGRLGRPLRIKMFGSR